MATPKDLPNGCLWIWESDKDYVLCKWDSDLLPSLVKKDEVRFEYNQYANKWSWVSCTIFAAVGMYSDLTNYQFSYDEIKDIDDSSYDNPEFEHIRHKWEWRYVKDAVDCVRKYVNNRADLVEKYWKVASYRISKYDDDIVEDALQKLYTLDWNIWLNSKYNDDKKDGMVDWTDFGYNTNWHSIDFICKDWQRSVKDSWSTKNNIYWLKHKLSEISNIWRNLYIFTLVKEDNLWEIKRLNEIKAECNLLIEHLQKLYGLVNDTNFQWILHYTADKLRAKIDTCNEMLKNLN